MCQSLILELPAGRTVFSTLTAFPQRAAGLLHQKETARHLLGSLLVSVRAEEGGPTLLAHREPGHAEDVEVILLCSLNS